MHRVRASRTMLLAVAVAGSAIVAVTAGDSGGPVSAFVRTTPIKHIIIIAKENRSFDNYFGRFPGANGATTANKSDGTVVDLAVTPDALPNDISHNTPTWGIAFNGGLMNGFDKEFGAYSATGQPLALSQMRESGIPNYWAYAKQYAIADNFFSSWKGNSFANNLYSIAAQAGIYDPTLGHRTVYSNPFSRSVAAVGGRLAYWGCDDPADTTVPMIDPDTLRRSAVFPCFNFRSLPDVLSQHGISWKMYNTVGSQSIHNPLDAISSVRFDPAKWANVQRPSVFFRDAAAGTLPSVAWIVGGQLEHPPASSCAGENQTVSYVNAVMNGPEWDSTVILVVWDEWGGFYDHVKPPQPNGLSFGFRVPMIAISPFTDQGSSVNGGSISHTFYDNGSLLKFIEANWGLQPLTPHDAAANSLMDMFDFSPTAVRKDKLILPQRVCAPLTAQQAAQLAVNDPD